MESLKSAAAMPLTQLLIESPRHSTRYLFHLPFLKAVRAAGLLVKSSRKRARRA
jgi:hypothetical protein